MKRYDEASAMKCCPAGNGGYDDGRETIDRRRGITANLRGTEWKRNVAGSQWII